MSGELGSTDFEKNGAPSRNRGGSQGPLAITWSAVEFAVDSPLEEAALSLEMTGLSAQGVAAVER